MNGACGGGVVEVEGWSVYGVVGKKGTVFFLNFFDFFVDEAKKIQKRRRKSKKEPPALQICCRKNREK